MIGLVIILLVLLSPLLPNKYNPLWYLSSHPAKIVKLDEPLSDSAVTELNKLGYLVIDKENPLIIRL